MRTPEEAAQTAIDRVIEKMKNGVDPVVANLWLSEVASEMKAYGEEVIMDRIDAMAAKMKPGRKTKKKAE